MEPDYLAYSNLDQYLFNRVSEQFAKDGKIAPMDFAAILSWKAHRKASSQIQRLGGANGFAQSVEQISIAIHEQETPQARLDYLMDEKRFRLPTASAILAVLFPLEFAVYDYRLRDELKFRPIHTNRPGERWARYQEYCDAIRKAAPPNYSLREADKYLWGRSRYEALNKLIG